MSSPYAKVIKTLAIDQQGMRSRARDAGRVFAILDLARKGKVPLPPTGPFAPFISLYRWVRRLLRTKP